jgi:hypothetical protein
MIAAVYSRKSTDPRNIERLRKQGRRKGRA